MKKGVYAGSFDPITNGHFWMIQQGVQLFDEFVVAIGTNPDKKYTFCVEERAAMLRESITAYPNIQTATFENKFLVNYARSINAKYILRGIRSEGDYEFEREMRHINSDLDDKIITVFLIPPREIAEVSSSVVKGVVGLEKWEEVVEKYVPPPVFQRFLEKHYGERTSG